MIGADRKNKPEFPAKMSNREVRSSPLYFTEDTTVVKYITKKYKIVFLMSTLHYDKEIRNRPNKKYHK